MSAASREAILEAAAGELADRGFDGVRLEHVARRAGFNKALIYRYFGDRVALLQAARRRRFAQRETLLDRLPASLGAMLRWWTRQQQADPHFMRLILREALQDDGGEPVEGPPVVFGADRQGRAGGHVRFEDGYVLRVEIA